MGLFIYFWCSDWGFWLFFFWLVCFSCQIFFWFGFGRDGFLVVLLLYFVLIVRIKKKMPLTAFLLMGPDFPLALRDF